MNQNLDGLFGNQSINSNSSQPNSAQFFNIIPTSTPASSPNLLDDFDQSKKQNTNNSDKFDLLNLMDASPPPKENNDILQLYNNNSNNQDQTKIQNDLIDMDFFGDSNDDQNKLAGSNQNNKDFISNRENDLHLNIQFPSDFLTPEEKSKQHQQDILNGGMIQGFGSPELERQYYDQKEAEKNQQMQLQPNHKRPNGDNFVLFNGKNQKVEDEEEENDFDLLTPNENESDNEHRGFVFPGNSNLQENDLFDLALNSQKKIDSKIESSQNVDSNDLLSQNQTTADSDQNDESVKKNAWHGDELVSLIQPQDKTYSDDLFSFNQDESKKGDLLLSSFDQLNSTLSENRFVDSDKNSSAGIIDDIFGVKQNEFKPSFDQFSSNNYLDFQENTNELKIEIPDEEDELENNKEINSTSFDQLAVNNSNDQNEIKPDEENKRDSKKDIQEVFNPSFDDFAAAGSIDFHKSTNELKIDIPDEEENVKTENKSEAFNPSFDDFVSANSDNLKGNANEIKLDIIEKDKNDSDKENENQSKKETFNPSFEQFTPSFNDIKNSNTDEIKLDISDDDDETENTKERPAIGHEIFNSSFNQLVADNLSENKLDENKKDSKENIPSTFNPSFDDFAAINTNDFNESTKNLKIEIPDEEEEKPNEIEKEKVKTENKSDTFNPSFDNFVATNSSDFHENTNELKIEIPDEEEEKPNEIEKEKVKTENKSDTFNPSFDNFVANNSSDFHENTNELKIEIPDEEEEKFNEIVQGKTQTESKSEKFSHSFDNFVATNSNNSKESTNEIKLNNIEEEEDKSDSTNEKDNENESKQEVFSPQFEQFTPIFSDIKMQNTDELKLEISDEEEEIEVKAKDQEEPKEKVFAPSFDQFMPNFNVNQKNNTNELKIEIPDDDSDNQNESKQEKDFNPSFDQFQFSFGTFNPNEGTKELKIDISDDDFPDKEEFKDATIIEREIIPQLDENNSKESDTESDDDFESLNQNQEYRSTRSSRKNPAQPEKNKVGAENVFSEKSVDEAKQQTKELGTKQQTKEPEAKQQNKESETAQQTKEPEVKQQNKESETTQQTKEPEVKQQNKESETAQQTKEPEAKQQTKEPGTKQQTRESEVKQQNKDQEANQQEKVIRKIKDDPSASHSWEKSDKLKGSNDEADHGNGNEAKISAKDNERRIFHLPCLPFSSKPVRFSFEAMMKPDESQRVPQFKSLPIPKLHTLAKGNEMTTISPKKPEEVAESKSKSPNIINYDDDRFGILNAFDSSSSLKVHPKQNQQDSAIEKPSLTENIENMKCFSIFKKYLEVRNNS